jgi:DNA ligase (NAD+)
MEIDRLKKAGLCFESTLKEPEKVSNVLEGKSFLISGVFQNYERDQLKDIIIAHGGKVLSSISGKLDFLLAGENMGPAKREKAEKLDIKIISESEFDVDDQEMNPKPSASPSTLHLTLLAFGHV